jgi:hypothetical protein
LWITRDRAAYGSDAFYGQLYKSEGPVVMNMIHAPTRFLIRLAASSSDEPASIENKPLRFSLTLNTQTGEGMFKDPADDSRSYRFSLGRPLGTACFFSFRTNSLAVTVEDFRILKLPS